MPGILPGLICPCKVCQAARHGDGVKIVFFGVDMKKLTFCMAVSSAMALVGTAWAGKDKEEPQLRLELDLVDGSHIIGTPDIESVPVQTSYAKMDIDLKQILTIKIAEDHENASIDLRNGDKLKGVINLEPIKLETVFGNVASTQ